MSFKLKNYTTNVNWSRTVVEVEMLLAGFGAKDTTKEYGDFGRVKSLAFRLDINGNDLQFRLPLNYENTFVALQEQGVAGFSEKHLAGNPARIESARLKAVNVTWRILEIGRASCRERV